MRDARSGPGQDSGPRPNLRLASFETALKTALGSARIAAVDLGPPTPPCSPRILEGDTEATSIPPLWITAVILEGRAARESCKGAPSRHLLKRAGFGKSRYCRSIVCSKKGAGQVQALCQQVDGFASCMRELV
jgi:hypothetical protein